jgi:nucleoside phosphorylase/CheY-like chemotaxis protein
MIKILIVDDDYDKSKNMMNVILENTNLSNEVFDFVTNTTEAREKLTKSIYDIVLLDMNIATYFGGEQEENGGLDLIEKIKTNQVKYVPNHIIATSQYSKILEDYKDELESNLLAFIQYDSSSDDWHQQIINKVNYAIKSKKNLYGNPFSKFDIAIIAALENPELSAVFSLPGLEWVEFKVSGDSTFYYQSIIKTSSGKNLNIVCAHAPRMGMTSSAILTTKMCMHFQPNYLFMIGIAAGIKGNNRNFGDILVTQNSWDWGSGKIAETDGTQKFEPDHTQVTLDEDIESKIRNLIKNEELFRKIKKEFINGTLPDNDLRLHIGPIASGSSVIASSKIINDIKDKNRKIIGVDMEIHGVMLATRYSTKSKPIVVCIKSICDLGDEQKDDKWQSYASYTSAKFMKEFITNWLFD